MLFSRKKKGMIDVGELVKQGKVRKAGDSLPDFNTNKDGFVDMGHPSNSSEKKVVKTNGFGGGSGAGGGFIDFMNVGSSGGGDGGGEEYSKKEVDSKIQKLDTMIYKLEQRVELLERKAGVNSSMSNSSDSSSVGAMGW